MALTRPVCKLLNKKSLVMRLTCLTTTFFQNTVVRFHCAFFDHICSQSTCHQHKKNLLAHTYTFRAKVCTLYYLLDTF